MDIKDTLKSLKVIKLTPFYDRAKTTSQAYSKLVDKEQRIQARTPEGEVMHKNIETSITWYIKLLKNFAKAGLDEDKIKFDDLVEKYGSLVNLTHVPFSNPEKVMGYIEPLEEARSKVGEIVPEVDADEDFEEMIVLSDVAGDVEIEDDLFGDDEVELAVVSDDSLAESEREGMSAIFADDSEITEDTPDPLSKIGNSGEALDSHIPVPISQDRMVEALAMTPPTVYERRVPRGKNPYKRP